MILIDEIKESQFKKQNFKFVIGEYATYNKYFKIILVQDEMEVEIGLQTVTGGSKPQAEIFYNRLLLIAGNDFYVYDLNGKIIKQFLTDSIYYKYIIRDNSVLVINELSVFLLDSNFEKTWSKDFNEIIDIVEVEEAKIVLQDYNNQLIYLDYFTGKEVAN